MSDERGEGAPSASFFYRASVAARLATDGGRYGDFRVTPWVGGEPGTAPQECAAPAPHRAGRRATAPSAADPERAGSSLRRGSRPRSRGSLRARPPRLRSTSRAPRLPGECAGGKHGPARGASRSVESLRRGTGERALRRRTRSPECARSSWLSRPRPGPIPEAARDRPRARPGGSRAVARNLPLPGKRQSLPAGERGPARLPSMEREAIETA